MRVAVDLDDVVLDFRKGICDSFNIEFGGSAKPEDFTAWDVPIMAPYTETFEAAGYEGGWAWLRDRDWVWPQWPPIPGAIGGLLQLHTQGYDVEILTSKPDWARHCVSKWLGKWRPYYDRVTIVSPEQRKVDRSDADILVDDKPENCVEFCEAGRRAVLFGQPWNQFFYPHVADYSRMGYADDWVGVVRQVAESPLWATAGPEWRPPLFDEVMGFER